MFFLQRTLLFENNDIWHMSCKCYVIVLFINISLELIAVLPPKMLVGRQDCLHKFLPSSVGRYVRLH